MKGKDGHLNLGKEGGRLTDGGLKGSPGHCPPGLLCPGPPWQTGVRKPKALRLADPGRVAVEGLC